MLGGRWMVSVHTSAKSERRGWPLVTGPRLPVDVVPDLVAVDPLERLPLRRPEAAVRAPALQWSPRKL